MIGTSDSTGELTKKFCFCFDEGDSEMFWDSTSGTTLYPKITTDKW